MQIIRPFTSDKFLSEGFFIPIFIHFRFCRRKRMLSLCALPFLKFTLMNIKEIDIRETKSKDINRILEIVEQAFSPEDVAKLVDELLTDKTAEPIVSLLAFVEGKAIGYILFTRVCFEQGQNQPLMHILTVLAVAPELQRQGIGKELIKAGIQKLQKKGSILVFVLGHREYYPKYGFTPNAASLGYPTPYPIPEENNDCWMVRTISIKGFEVGKGKIKCADMLNKPEHWTAEKSDSR